MKSIKVLFLATAACLFTSACTVSPPEDNCNEDSDYNIMCYEYSRDDCGNIICAPHLPSSFSKVSSSSTVKSSSSVKESSSSSIAKSSSSNKKASSSSIAKNSSSITVKSSSSVKGSSSSSIAKSSSSNKKASSSSIANNSSSSNELSSSSEKSKTIYEAVNESGKYTSRDSVAAYLCKFDKLPTNYVTQNEGKSLYESKTGNAFNKWNFNPWTTIGVMIGGDKFGNNEGLLPKGTYHEADVDYTAKNRGTKRLVYQSDCIIYYTADHYESFSKLEIQ